jgi:hypothetical protein
MKIQSYEPSVSPVTPTLTPPRPLAPVDGAYGENVAKAVEGLGDVGLAIGMKMMAHAEEQQREKDNADIANIDTNFTMSMQDKLWNQDDEKVVIEGNEVVRKKGFLNRELGATANSAVEFEQLMSKEIPAMIATGRTPEIQAKCY